MYTLGLFQKKTPGGWEEGETAGDIFFEWWLVQKLFKLYGSLVFDRILLHGWLFRVEF